MKKYYIDTILSFKSCNTQNKDIIGGIPLFLVKKHNFFSKDMTVAVFGYNSENKEDIVKALDDALKLMKSLNKDKI